MEKEIKQRKPIDWENIATYIFYGLIFLLPIFILPLTLNPLVLSKATLAYLGIGLAFIFWLMARLQRGNLVAPKSGLLLSLAGLVIVWLLASIFSLNFKLSFFGAGYEIGTFIFFLFFGLAVFLISVLFQSEKKAAVFYFLLFLSSVLVFIFQAIQIGPIGPIGPIGLIGDIFPFKTSNLAGGWNDFSIFFGFIALSALVFFELFDFGKRIKIALLCLLGLSLLAMVAVSFTLNWYIFGFFVIFFLVYFFSRNFPFSKDSSLETKGGSFYSARKLIGLSFFVLILVFFFILAKGLLADLTAFLGTDVVDVRPSWTATYEVVSDTLKERPILGSGPNTFLYDWLKFKPEAINSTIFWNTRFQSGIGVLPSFIAATGIVGGLALLAFLIMLLYYVLKAISCTNNDLKRALLVASLLGSLYLWTFAVFYSPGFLIFALAFATTGILIALLVQAEKIKNIEISFLKNPKIGFVSVLLTVFLLLATVLGLYLFSQKYYAAYSYFQGAKTLNIEGDLDKAETDFVRAARLDNQDVYFRTLSDVGILRMQQILSQTETSPDVLRNQFQGALGTAIQNAQFATNLNSFDPLNWIQLAKIYESVAPLNIEGAKEFALGAYQEALNKSPLDPTPYLLMARLEAQAGNMDKAREWIDSALAMKGDFAAALLFLSQIEAQEGNLDEAIKRAEQTVAIAPNDAGGLFQLGLFYYQNKNYENARFALERAVAFNPDYSNARYFLGLIYDKQGLASKAMEQFKRIEELNPDNEEVKSILSNLRQGRAALQNISPPAEPPEERKEPPVEE